jgi:hypothetical protein
MAIIVKYAQHFLSNRGAYFGRISPGGGVEVSRGKYRGVIVGVSVNVGV